jgi:hypothetical protein
MSPIQWLRSFEAELAFPELPVSRTGQRLFQCGDFCVEAKVIADAVLVKTVQDHPADVPETCTAWTYRTNTSPQIAASDLKSWLAGR